MHDTARSIIARAAIIIGMLFSAGTAHASHVNTTPSTPGNVTVAPIVAPTEAAVMPTVTAPAPAVVTPAQPRTILQAVLDARAALLKIVADRNAISPQPYKVANGNSARITLAVWDKNTDEI